MSPIERLEQWCDERAKIICHADDKDFEAREFARITAYRAMIAWQNEHIVIRDNHTPGSKSYTIHSAIALGYERSIKLVADAVNPATPEPETLEEDTDGVR